MKKQLSLILVAALFISQPTIVGMSRFKAEAQKLKEKASQTFQTLKEKTAKVFQVEKAKTAAAAQFDRFMSFVSELKQLLASKIDLNTKKAKAKVIFNKYKAGAAKALIFVITIVAALVVAKLAQEEMESKKSQKRREEDIRIKASNQGLLDRAQLSRAEVISKYLRDKPAGSFSVDVLDKVEEIIKLRFKSDDQINILGQIRRHREAAPTTSPTTREGGGDEDEEYYDDDGMLEQIGRKPQISDEEAARTAPLPPPVQYREPGTERKPSPTVKVLP